MQLFQRAPGRPHSGLLLERGALLPLTKTGAKPAVASTSAIAADPGMQPVRDAGNVFGADAKRLCLCAGFVDMAQVFETGSGAAKKLAVEGKFGGSRAWPRPGRSLLGLTGNVR